MKRTVVFVIIWTLTFIGLLATAAGYEYVTLTDAVPNNAISHGVKVLTEHLPWLPVAFVIFAGVLFAFSLTCALHWWSRKKFWWKPAVWKDDEGNNND